MARWLRRTDQTTVAMCVQNAGTGRTERTVQERV